ncbi:hypothetical protein [Roseomonas sp. AR75]|jgi:hypothetical protein|uniref:hypothetical protein n=1 Tax=Roseomonas sp. AR75 TaxID=2562311 RepID=UPI0014856902|nr:hypothetical protein [Roseomonas sp. AR75]
MTRVPLQDASIELDGPAERGERLSPPAAVATIAALSVLSWVAVIALIRMLVG